MTLTELRDALAKATGPDASLDKVIAEWLGWVDLTGPYTQSKWRMPDGTITSGFGCPAYTASIDAAVTLFGPEWLLVELSDIAADGLSLAKFCTAKTPVQEALGIGGRSLALTICLARIEYEIAKAQP